MKNSPHLMIALFILVFLTILIAPASIHAQVIRDAHVFTERDTTGESVKCQMSTDATQAAVETALRQNRIAVLPDSPGRLNVYVNLNIMEVDRANCVVNLMIQFLRFELVEIANIRKQRIGAHEFCMKQVLFLYGKSRIQTQVNDDARSLTERCISEVERKFN
jgi:hypothetical protein